LLDRTVTQGRKIKCTHPSREFFHSLQMTNWPPFPFLPFPELPVYATKLEGVYWYDDRLVDYAAIREQAAKSAQEGNTGEGEGGGMAMMSGGSGFRLKIPTLSGQSLSTSLIEADTNSAYDIFQKLVLQPNVKWLRVAGGGIGQTNFSLSVPSTNTAFLTRPRRRTLTAMVCRMRSSNWSR
jgi:hypothetical protein